jgi:hypothetical protein
LRKYIKPGMKLTNKIHAEACHIYYTWTTGLLWVSLNHTFALSLLAANAHRGKTYKKFAIYMIKMQKKGSYSGCLFLWDVCCVFRDHSVKFNEL